MKTQRTFAQLYELPGGNQVDGLPPAASLIASSCLTWPLKAACSGLLALSSARVENFSWLRHLGNGGRGTLRSANWACQSLPESLTKEATPSVPASVCSHGGPLSFVSPLGQGFVCFSGVFVFLCVCVGLSVLEVV